MQLKKLQLLGFKTFADKTEIEIGAGLTAIVGPNGSGKSNIVDALLWVLGEQNPRLLRGNAAQDVIFAGTDRRKPLGMAEVKLTVDNSDGVLPVKFAEVVVTRRIYRSGESQYLLNNSPCRLKDIVELFLDTGVGKGAYAFVSQQEIDAVLSARPEDRRELFEEAAGIKKYRVKKREALRKLEAAETHLNRVGDIIAEIEVQREPMEKQAIAARRYILLQERLHEIEIGLLVAEVQKADYELHAGKLEQEADQTALLNLEAAMARVERATVEVAHRLTQAEAELEAARQARQACALRLERTESQLSLVTERSQTARKTREQAMAELKEIADRIEALTAELRQHEVDGRALEALEAQQRDAWSARKAGLVELEAALQEALRAAEQRQSERVRLAQQKSANEAALRSARDRIADFDVRLERLTLEVAALAHNEAETSRRVEAAREAIDRTACRRAALAERRETLETTRRTTLAAQEATRTALDSARRTLAEQTSRLSTLTELQQSHEGFYQGVRAVLNAEKQGRLKGHFKAVVDLLTVPEPYRVAIEVALGGSLQDIVTLTEAEAKAGIEWLKQNRAGRATFLALPLLRSGTRLAPPRSSGSGDPEIENAMDVVTCDPQYAPALQLLLGRTLIVQDMDAAIAVSRRITGWSRIVTHSGELLSPGGALTGGSLQGRGAHLVGRKGEIDDLTSNIPMLKRQVAQRTEEMERAQKDIAELDADRALVAREESDVASEAAAAESALAAAERELARVARDRQERLDAQTGLATASESLRNEAARLSREAAAGSAETENAEEAFTALNEQTRGLAAQRDACRAGAVALEVEVSRLREKREGLTRAAAANRAALAALEQQHASKSAQRGSAEAAGTDAAAERQRLQSELEDAGRALATAETTLALATEHRQALAVESQSTAAALREYLEKRNIITRSLHETELRLARLDVQISQAVQRLHEEYSITREEALARPEETSIDKGTAIEVGRLRRELRAMGQVNTGAVAEYDRLTERFDYLTSQRSDLDKSRESLLKTIDEIDDSTRGVFIETFEAVRQEFDRLFKRLFDGGGTKLVLTDPDDVLETGIEVIAQPPGKKAQHLSLLSGGERALTATALLFAFLAVRPSPFVLLDEVDAPLDGANVEKFTHLVRDFSARSQFLLITHNPTTMEAAPTWYGITMREPGVSSVLSYRVPEQTAPTEEHPAVVLA